MTRSSFEHASPSTRNILPGQLSSMTTTLTNGQSLGATSICPNLRPKDGIIPYNYPSLVLDVSAVARGKCLSETFKMRRGKFGSIRGCFKKDLTGKDLPWRPRRSDSVAKVAKVWEVAEEDTRIYLTLGLVTVLYGALHAAAGTQTFLHLLNDCYKPPACSQFISHV